MIKLDDLILTKNNKGTECSKCPLNGEIKGKENSCDINIQLTNQLKDKYGYFFCQNYKVQLK